jgi:hypothetical protein
MRFIRLGCPPASQPSRTDGVLRRSAFFCIGVLGLGLAACDRKPTPSALPPKPSRGEREVAPAKREVPPAAPVVPPASAERVPHLGGLPLYELKMDSGDLMKLDRAPRSDDTPPATFIADGEVYAGRSCGVRWPGCAGTCRLLEHGLARTSSGTPCVKLGCRYPPLRARLRDRGITSWGRTP